MKQRILQAKSTAFTMLEIMTALVIFSGSMMAYLGYQSSVARVLYDAQSSSTAGTLAEDLVESINAMDIVEFNNLILSTPMDLIQSDNDIALYVRNLRDGGDAVAFTGPFTSEGKPLHDAGATGNGLFYRSIRINTYGAETNNSGFTIDQLYFYFYHIEIIISWPNVAAPLTLNCSNIATVGCDRIHVHFMKGIK
ncbi:hypothetical protein KAH37_01865 [bacterium]|nr:hypothetical protein [bacterium]